MAQDASPTASLEGDSPRSLSLMYSLRIGQALFASFSEALSPGLFPITGMAAIPAASTAESAATPASLAMPWQAAVTTPRAFDSTRLPAGRPEKADRHFRTSAPTKYAPLHLAIGTGP